MQAHLSSPFRALRERRPRRPMIMQVGSKRQPNLWFSIGLRSEESAVLLYREVVTTDVFDGGAEHDARDAADASCAAPQGVGRWDPSSWRRSERLTTSRLQRAARSRWMEIARRERRFRPAPPMNALSRDRRSHSPPVFSGDHTRSSADFECRAQGAANQNGDRGCAPVCLGSVNPPITIRVDRPL
jgi:hypothetical protein